ncbi:sortase [Streptomyces sp. NPDC013178]|uniref:sortase n=1 Tax=unclassified Streptomyces TaxID=2593676 RepID=UPI0033F13417
MRNTCMGVGMGLIIGVLALQGPAAVAAGDSGVDIYPGKASPGSTVTVRTTACGADVTYGKGESEAGGKFHLFEGDHKGELKGRFTVPEGIEDRTDTITVKCPPRIKITDTYEISDHRPNGAVEAGFGDASDSNTQLVLGSVLIAAAGAGWLVRMRHRSNGHRT